jgi:hypothetical protein
MFLGTPRNGEFKRQIPQKRESPASYPLPEKKLITKSNLKPSSSAPVKDYGPKYRKREFKGAMFSDDDDDDENKLCSDPPMTQKSTSSFIQPPDFFIDIKVRPHKASAATSATTSSSFRSPDNILRSFDISMENSFEEPIDFDIPDLIKSSPSHRNCKFCRKILPVTFTQKPPTAARARFAYCQSHENASILEDGKVEGFPSSFNFATVKNRVINLLPKVRGVISSPEESEFIAEMRANTSLRNAAAPMTMFNLFEKNQPGYYGPRGAELISEIVMAKMGEDIRNRKSLLKSLKFCGGVMAFITSSVVPEVGVSLIMEDLDVDREEAKRVMKESISYGNVINPSVDVISTDDEEEEEEDY